MSGSQLNDSPGAILARARTALGVSERDVADTLNLPLSTIVALEEDDSERLPAYVFTRGYVRAYAKLLDLDPDPLVATLAQDLRDEGPEQKEYTPTPTLLGFDYRAMLAGGGVLLLVVGGVVWFALSGAEPETPATSQPVNSVADVTLADSPQPTPVPESAATAVPAGGEVVVAASEPVDAVTAMIDRATAQVEQTPTTEPTEVPTTELGEIDLQAQDNAGQRRLTQTGQARLRMVFSEDCWVSIDDAQGERLFGDLGRPGRDFEFVGQGPFTILLGYAPGVELTYNDETVALAPHTRNNVARLVIGQ